MEMREFYLSCKKEELHCVEWRPDGEIKAVLQIVHGMLEYICRYGHFAAYLCSQGIAVVGHDHPGHGNTAKSRDGLGCIEGPDGSTLMCDCTLAVTEYIRENYKGVKNFILGHSMGSFVVRRFITENSHKVSGAVIVGTGEMPHAVLSAGLFLAKLTGFFKGKRAPSKLLTTLSFAGYNKKFPKEEGEHAWISSDREVVEKYDKDPFCTCPFKVSGFIALYETLIFLSKKKGIDKIRKDLPIFVCAGGLDPVGNYSKGPRAVFETYKKEGICDCTLQIYDNDRHEIINEKDRDRVYRDLSDFILQRI